jgi:ABC-type phosphate transport system permease subunit
MGYHETTDEYIRSVMISVAAVLFLFILLLNTCLRLLTRGKKS